MYYVYTLFSLKDKNFYVGYTADLKKRIKEHIQGKVESTKFRRPLKLVYYEVCLNRYDSVKREKYFKTSLGRRYLRNRLKYYFKNKRPMAG